MGNPQEVLSGVQNDQVVGKHTTAKFDQICATANQCNYLYQYHGCLH